MEPKHGAGDKGIISELRSKHSARPWSETQQLVRRCLLTAARAPETDKSKADFSSSPLLISCLSKLHEAMNECSASTIISRLETIAMQRGLGSHLSPTESTCYLTSDMFYVEVLLSGNGVQDVKLAQHGEAPESSETLLKLLRLNKYEEFSTKLDCLNSFYSIPGDNEIKIKIYNALQCLEKDLLKISNLPRSLEVCDVHVDTVLNGRIGYIVPRREGNPVTIEYYLSPYDILMETKNAEQITSGHLALVTPGTIGGTQRLPTSSLIPQPPQIASQGLPVFSPLEESNSDELPSCFLLRLRPPLAMLSSIVLKVQKITGLILSDLKWMPYPQLLLENILEENGCSGSWENGDAHFVLLPKNQTYSFALSEAVENPTSLEGSFVRDVPFSHPAHVPALLELLRHQSALNTLLFSCITCYRPCKASEADFHCEVILENDSSLSLHFSQAHSDSLTVLVVNVEDSRQISCRLFPRGLTDALTDDYLSRVLKRCMSIPVTMRALYWRIMASLTVETSPETSTLITTENESLAASTSCPVAETNVSLPVEEPAEIPMEPSAEVSGNEKTAILAASVGSYYVISATSPQNVDSLNTETSVKPYPAQCDAFPGQHWSTNEPMTI
ncbi:mediator of RNA polymerase II transcription subunit 1 isoform X2 [Brienomyrus brachyistius]|uniref:mediator of RNA polymerase II transcription subunit 1 isoform X2 n=1 Tax=Brienomyrus brachyistius TaxID=42636 RepID=UPI0020B18051|nr:mediator of RNA polymerase II transcription subunit 1 isoform X2 [Brienomyrus brachyistius]